MWAKLEGEKARQLVSYVRRLRRKNGEGARTEPLRFSAVGTRNCPSESCLLSIGHMVLLRL